MKFDSAPPITKTESSEGADVIADFQGKEYDALSKLSKTSKTARALMFATALAGLTACGGENEHLNSSNPENESAETSKKYTVEEWNERIRNGIYSDNPHRQAKYRQLRKRQARFRETNKKYLTDAARFAKSMGIEFDPHSYKLKSEGHIVTSINGHKVPERLYTEEEERSIETARSMKNMMNSTGDSNLRPIIGGQDAF